MKKKYIPKYLNAEPQILWWDLSEFLILFVFVAIGILANMQFTGLVIGVIVLRIVGKLSNNKPAGFIKHYFYSKGMWGMVGKVPEFWIKELGR